MNNDWKPTEINEGQPTNWEPRKQHPEEVADGLRNAFRQAMKDGVMDATPYLKQMTYKSDIQKTEKEIAVLQKKLELLKEIETHKSQPRMNLQFNVKGEVVSYNDEVYYRLEFTDGSHGWYKKKHTVDGLVMVAITDGETRRLLEGLWFNDVKKGKYDDVTTTEPYKNVRAYWND
jgi:methionyl-tRNA formyltransferase